jgi:hypothetical protein
MSIEFNSMPKNVIHVVGPSHLSGAKGMPMSSDARCMALREFEQTKAPAGPSVKKSSR